jgi:hypothetical protein
MKLFTHKKIIIGSALILLITIATGINIYRLKITTAELDAFKELTKNDPLFYSPFFDTPAFISAVDNLEKSEQVLKKTALNNLATISAAYGQEYSDLIRNTPLFPTNFLKLLPKIAQSTDDFLANPTRTKARTLLSQYEHAQSAYEDNARMMTEAFAEIDAHIPDDRPLFYFFTDSATSLKIVQSDFELIYQNSLALKTEIQSRRDCLSGKQPCPVTTAKTLSSEIITQATPVIPSGKNTALISETLPFTNMNRTVAGPYIISSSCWSDAKKEQQMYAIYSEKNGATSVLPKLADENYYRLVSSQVTDAIGKAIREKGLSMYNQPEGTTYECSDLTFYPEILKRDFLHNEMTKNNVSTETITSSQNYAHLWNNPFGILTPALQSLADYTNLLETSQRIGTDFVLSPQFLFITRSAYSLTYLPIADSVWRLETQPTYQIARDDYIRMNTRKPFATLTELQKRGISNEDIKKAHVNQWDLIESLVK